MDSPTRRQSRRTQGTAGPRAKREARSTLLFGRELDRWRVWLVASYGVLIVILVLLWAWTLWGPLSKSARAGEENNALVTLSATEAALRTLDASTSDLAAENAAASALFSEIVGETNAKIALVSQDGVLVAGSGEESGSINAETLDAPEFAEALAGEVGTDRRGDHGKDTGFFYAAKLVDYQEGELLLRVSIPFAATNFFLLCRTLLVITVVFAVVSAALFTLLISHPVGSLTRRQRDLVATASHELKTPIAGIKLLSETISAACERGDLDTVQVFAERLDTESNRLQDIVTGVLEFSKTQGGQHPRAGEQADLHGAAMRAFESCRFKAEEKGLEYVFRDEEGRGDACRVVLRTSEASLLADTLIDNAVTYTAQGYVHVVLRAERQGLVFEVRDTGVGIPEDERGRVFEKYYRTDSARADGIKGTGLGLAIVQNIVEESGGTITIADNPDGGTVFTVRLPQKGSV